MFKIITPFLSISLLISLLASCASPTEEEKPAEPVKAPAVEVEAPAQPEANPTEGWIMLADDTKLPTEDQLADGAETSLGAADANSGIDNRPSTSVKPPAIEPEDQLAPSE